MPSSIARRRSARCSSSGTSFTWIAPMGTIIACYQHVGRVLAALSGAGRATAEAGRGGRVRVGGGAGQDPAQGGEQLGRRGGDDGGAGVEGVLAVELDPAGAGVDEHGLG